MRSFTVTTSLPPKALHPNARSRTYHKKAKATKAYRALVKIDAQAALRCDRPMLVKATARAVFYFAKPALRDEDNAQASLKAAWDALADAGLLANDRGLTHERPVFNVDRIRPRVELTIRELPAPAGGGGGGA